MSANNINIYVGNLPLEMTEDELRKEFVVFGDVVSVTIIDDKYIGSGQQRRYAYVEMASRSEGETAIANLEGKRMRNTIVNIIRALPLSNRQGAGSLNIRANNQFSRISRKGFKMNS
jgi:RNA recognition motif-containing protein